MRAQWTRMAACEMRPRAPMPLPSLADSQAGQLHWEIRSPMLTHRPPSRCLFLTNGFCPRRNRIVPWSMRTVPFIGDSSFSTTLPARQQTAFSAGTPVAGSPAQPSRTSWLCRSHRSRVSGDDKPHLLSSTRPATSAMTRNTFCLPLLLRRKARSGAKTVAPTSGRQTW